MNANEIRQKFFDFFEKKEHKIIESAPMVVKDDPTLMFVNAGMNQFKDLFLGNKKAEFKRVANTQKCLRVSGKHNDLEEVGKDTYHHTMFEMLGNWSFGDYFKKQAIEYAWELITQVYKIPKEKLYVTVFEGDKKDNLDEDTEAYKIWEKIIDKKRIIKASKKDNFWEMGETGPCGPCSEIHIDMRDDEQIQKKSGKELVNADHPEVFEVWNLVFIQYNRFADGSLKPLPNKHVDTGMGLERLVSAIQNKKSNYDTDIFQPILKFIEQKSGIKYGQQNEKDIAMRIIADHLRAVTFSIVDGQLPSNTAAGYVIRRILRRAVRYYYTFLNIKQAFIYSIVPTLAKQMKNIFPQIEKQIDIIKKIIKQEEEAFLNTIEKGIKQFKKYVDENKYDTIDGEFAFYLYDSLGFPIDLTIIMAKEIGKNVDVKGFEENLKKQKKRSKVDAQKEATDWNILVNDAPETKFVGYDRLQTKVKIIKYRKLKQKKKEFFQLVFDQTPFYPQSGGQVGDRGIISENNEKYPVVDTIKENDLIIHIMPKIPNDLNRTFEAQVDTKTRVQITNNHSATHLLHSALKQILGQHVEQRGSLVNDKYLRFDFSHFEKLSEEQLVEIEEVVNTKIRENIKLDEKREIPIKEAQKMGATALFGEKYANKVRVITFDKNFSMELCGGTHVEQTGQIGILKIISESAIAAGIRRIEAITATQALNLIQEESTILKKVKNKMAAKNNNILKIIEKIVTENKNLTKEIEKLKRIQIVEKRKSLEKEFQKIGKINLLIKEVNIENSAQGKDLIFELKQNSENSIIVLGAKNNESANLWVMLSENLVKEHKLNAKNIINIIAKEIKGGGGGQPFFATAGGKSPEGIKKALEVAKKIIQEAIEIK